jgi:hypothetical protein
MSKQKVHGVGQKVMDYRLKNTDERIIWSLAAHMHCKKCLRITKLPSTPVFSIVHSLCTPFLYAAILTSGKNSTFF